MSRIAIFAAVLVSSLASSGCHIVVGDSRLSYGDVCSAQRSKCRADGDFAVYMPKDRPAFMHADPAGYLGTRVEVKNVRSLPKSCVPDGMLTNQYEAVFVRQLTASILTRRQLETSISAAVAASLPVALKDKPEVKASLELAVKSSLDENAYTNAIYTVYTLTNDFLRAIADAKEGDPLYACQQKLKQDPRDYGFVWSIAAITAEGKLKKVQIDQVTAAISGQLENLKLEAPLQAEIRAQIAASIVNIVQTDIDAQILRNNTIYSYGIWNHRLNEGWTNEDISRLVNVVVAPLRSIR